MLLLRAMLVTAVLCLAATSEAGIFYRDETDHGCADDMNTDDCFGPAVTGASGPTILACQAVGSLNQHCRACKDKYLASGAYAGYKTCAYVKLNAFCKCNSENTSECSGEGSCAYY